MTFEVVFQKAGGFGLYQKYVVVVCNLFSVTCSFVFLNTFFTLYVPPHRCAIPGYDNDTYAVQGPDHQRLINRTIPLSNKDDTSMYDACHLFADSAKYSEDFHPANASAIGCNKWVYDTSIFEETLSTKLNFVCTRKAYKSIGQMIFFAGVFAGSLISGLISDRFGRKVTSLVMLKILLAAGLALAWTPNYPFYLAFTFLTGAAAMAVFLPLHVLGMEYVGPADRKYASIVGNYLWVLGLLLMTWMAYSLRHWHHFLLAVILPNALCLAYWWLLPESLRWLVSRGRMEEAKTIFRKMEKYNKVTLSDDLLHKAHEDMKRAPKGRFWHVFTSRVLCTRTIILYFNWCVISLSYYGLALNSGNLGGSMFVNFALNSLMDLPAAILTLTLVDRIGRKPIHVTAMVTCGVACISTIFTTQFGGDDLQKVTLTLAMIGKIGVTSGYILIYLFSAELYPTVVRNTGMGACSCMARVGGMIAPYIADIRNLVGDSGGFGKALPMIIFGGLAIVAGLLTLFLPETHKRPLPETIEDAINIRRKVKKDKKVDEEKEIQMDQHPFLGEDTAEMT